MYKLTALIAIAFLCFITWIIYLANTGSNSIFFDAINLIPYGDKLGHFLLFGILTLTFITASDFKVFPLRRFNIYYGSAIVTLLVLAEEISQAYIPTRTFDFLDLAADSVGILAFTAISYFIKTYFIKSNPQQ